MKIYDENETNSSVSETENLDIQKEQGCITNSDGMETLQFESATSMAKEEKISGKTKKKKLTIILIVVFSIIFGLAGAVLGYIVYNLTSPKNDKVTLIAGETITDKEIEAIQKSISKGTVINDYQTAPYKLINYALDLDAKAKYSLILCKGSAVAVNVTQNIQSATFRTPDQIFNENISSSSMVSTANRYYDRKNNEVIQYECKNKDDWKSATPTTSNYDDYISRFGKLLSGIYYCTKDETRGEISDKFLTLNKEEFDSSKDASKFQVNSILIYSIGSNTVYKNKSIMEKKGDNYEITLSLKSTGESYYSVQMRNTGGLKSNPKFDPSVNKLIFTLDKNLNLVSSVFTDKYNADVGMIQASTTQTLTQYYFRGETNSFNGVDVKIPDIQDIEFNGYQLFK